MAWYEGDKSIQGCCFVVYKLVAYVLGGTLSFDGRIVENSLNESNLQAKQGMWEGGVINKSKIEDPIRI
jgi:hypothetical protein